jgi:hypothetical protein
LRSPESYPGLAPWNEIHTRVRFAQTPAFWPYSVWILQTLKDRAQVRRVEWDHKPDTALLNALPKIEPTTYGADAELPLDEASALLRELAAIRLAPFLPAKTIGQDGVTFEIESGNPWQSAHLLWWGDWPEEWQPLMEFFDRATDLFDRYLPVSTARHPKLQTEA